MSDYDGSASLPAESLCLAARALGDRVRAVVLHSPRPVFLFYLAQTFDQLGARCARGLRPDPATPAEQLCLYLMLTDVERGATGIDLSRERTRLTHGTDADIRAEVRAITGKSGDAYDFIALGDVLAAGGMGAFFAPFDSTDMVA
ncbi:hypothetical protein NONO_c41470 [Nocardia nova SH22a]|uniref:Uncharacterized protein n=1 Tax=Nocardia nova SH22a TaxID=1415166 RepID=W5TNX8_9NOCA|nr:hypothetical protein [Nocardia nova]AHH18931.1 hypothetical protein NONO_c41470 [Nocardia nova SH22a]